MGSNQCKAIADRDTTRDCMNLNSINQYDTGLIVYQNKLLITFGLFSLSAFRPHKCNKSENGIVVTEF